MLFRSLEGSRVNRYNIKKVIEVIKPDIIHAHDFTAGIMTSFSKTGIPIISHLHSNPLWIRRTGIRTFIYSLSCLKYERILTVSDSVMDEFVFGKFVKKKTKVVGNPVDIGSIKNKGVLAKKTDSSDIVFLGRLAEPKNPFLFLKIMKGVVDSIGNCQIAIVGDGELKEELRRKIKEYRLESHITLYGFQKNPYGLLNGSKILCMPSVWEGFGMAAIEALTFGKPVVCSGVGGLKDIVDDTCGKICSTLDSYVNEICILLNNEEYYRLKSKGAERKAQSMDNASIYCDTMRSLYESIIFDEERICKK